MDVTVQTDKQTRLVQFSVSAEIIWTTAAEGGGDGASNTKKHSV